VAWLISVSGDVSWSPGGSGDAAKAGEPSSGQPPIKSLSFSETIWSFAIKEHRDLEPIMDRAHPSFKLPFRRYFRPPLWRSEQQQIQGKNDEVLLDVVDIVDRQAGKSLHLDRKQKEFARGDAPPIEGLYDPEKYLGLAQLRTAIRESGKPLGAKKINGREAVGYRIDDEKPEWHRHREGQQMIDTSEVWLDAKTQRPLFYERIVASVSMPYHLVHVSILTRKDFVYDEKLDDALFSLKPPAGYKEGKPPKVQSLPASGGEGAD
jgi:hypothetical protein